MNESKANHNPFEKQINKNQSKPPNQKPLISIANRYCMDLANPTPNEAKPAQKYKVPPKRPVLIAKETEKESEGNAPQRKEDQNQRGEEDLLPSELKEPQQPSFALDADNELIGQKEDQFTDKSPQINGNEVSDDKQEDEPLDGQVETINNNNNENINPVRVSTEVNNNINDQFESEKDKGKEKNQFKDKQFHDRDQFHEPLPFDFNEHEHAESHSSPQTTESKEFPPEADKLKEDNNKEANGSGNENENEFDGKNKEPKAEKQVVDINKENSQEFAKESDNTKAQFKLNEYHQVPIKVIDRPIEPSNSQYFTLKKEFNELKEIAIALKAQNQSLENEVELLTKENSEQQAIINHLKRKELIEGEIVLRNQIEMLKNDIESKDKMNQMLIEENKRLINSIDTLKELALDVSSQSKEIEIVMSLPLPLHQTAIDNINAFEEQSNQNEPITQSKDKDKGEEGVLLIEHDSKEAIRPEVCPNDDNEEEPANKLKDHINSDSQPFSLMAQPQEINQAVGLLEAKQLSQESNMDQTKPSQTVKDINQLFDSNPQDNNDNQLTHSKANSVIISQTKDKDIFASNSNDGFNDAMESKGKGKEDITALKPLNKSIKTPQVKQNAKTQTQTQTPNSKPPQAQIQLESQFNYNEEEVSALFKSFGPSSQNSIFD